MAKDTNKSIAFGDNKLKKLTILWIILLGFVLATTVHAFAAAETKAAPKVPHVDRNAISQKIFKLQIPFIVNQGQIQDARIKFYVRTFGGPSFVNDRGEVIYSFFSANPQRSSTKNSLPSKEAKERVLKEKLVNAVLNAPRGIDRSRTRVNYFIGNDKGRWKSNIPTYKSVSLGEVYKGIDLSLKAYGKTVEKIFTVKPGVDPKAIKLEIEGADSIMINKNGELELKIGSEMVRFSKPVAYQEKKDKRVDVQVAYHLNNFTYGFRPVDYDRSLPLIIDPYLDYATYLGGSADDEAEGIAVDSSGNVYIAGETISPNFPTGGTPYQAGPAGSQDAFVTKINASGDSIIFSTYLGGSGMDSGDRIAIDITGNVYVTGQTASTDFPTQNAYQGTYGGNGDAFVTKINSSGSGLVYSTYLGGNADDFSEGIAVDSSANVYITGATYSTDFPTENPYQAGLNGTRDAFVTKINSSGDDLLYSTYLGGSNSDQGGGISVDRSGSAYITGRTESDNFPLVGPFQDHYGGNVDAFATKINPAGSNLLYSSYLGGDSTDTGRGVVVDSSGNAYITGSTFSGDFPTFNAYQSSFGGSGDAFATGIHYSGSRVLYSTYLGGSGLEIGQAIAVDRLKNVYIAGETASSNFPTVNAHQSGLNGADDAFVSRINSAGSGLLYSTYLGGGGSEVGFGIAVDNSGNVYVSGATSSTGFPTTNGTFEENFQGGGSDAFAAKISPQIWYVRQGGGLDGQNGTSWNYAFATINEAITAASLGDQIWVLEGTYNLSAKIAVNKAVAIYGSFDGTETHLSERDLTNIDSIVDGTSNTGQNNFVVTSDAIIDGFVIRNNPGGFSLSGGGVFIMGTPATIIANCIFNNNGWSSAVYDGGGIGIWDSSPTIENCTFTSNTAEHGGAISIRGNSNPSIENCLFSQNYAVEQGGAIYNQQSFGKITLSTFFQNSAGSDGGAIYNEDSAPLVSTCIFDSNSAANGGALNNIGAGYVPFIYNCTFYNNFADIVGGAIFNNDASTRVRNCILWGNIAAASPEIYDPDIPESISVTYSDVEVTSGAYTGPGNINLDPRFADPAGGDFHLRYNSPCIDAAENGPAAYVSFDADGEPRISDGDIPPDGFAVADMGADEYFDTDSDSLADYVETSTGTFVDENDTGTDPNNPDSDGDGLEDGDEVNLHTTTPTDPDTDADGLTDGDEVNVYGTSPTNPDDDGDTISDGIEVATGRDPLISEPVTTYDTFDGQWIDRTKWADLEFIRYLDPPDRWPPTKRIRVLRSETRRYGSSDSNWLELRNPEAAHTIEADITVTALINDNANPRARIGGFYYNAVYTDAEPGDRLDGEIFAQIGLKENGAGGALNVYYSVGRCEDTDCTQFTTFISDETYFGSVNLDDEHTFSIAWNWDGSNPATNTFTFGFDGSFVTPTDPLPAVTGQSKFDFKGLGTRVDEIDGPNEGGFIAAEFDAVFVNDLLYDHFDNISGFIDPTDWGSWEFIRSVESGTYKSAVTRYDENGGNTMSFIDANKVTAFRADVKVTDVVNPDNVWPRARLLGSFYNDGSPGSGWAGEIIAGVELRHHNDELEGRAWVTRCTWGDCNVTGEFETLELIPLAQGLQLNQAYTLTLAWDADNQKFVFGLDDITATSSVTLPAVVSPPRFSFKGLGTRVWVGDLGEGAHITADFDNVIDLTANSDNDDVPQAFDNCPDADNPDQTDTDGDLFGNACDDDDDDDGVLDNDEHPDCVDVFNPILPGDTSQPDFDTDGIPDACDPDADGDGENSFDYGGLDCEDLDPSIPSVTACITGPSAEDPPGSSTEPPDFDGDGKDDTVDNCPSISNRRQKDDDSDGIGNECDPCPNDSTNDADLDGICYDVDNCPEVANPTQANYDGDSQGDACDPDADGDGAISIYHNGNDCNDSDVNIYPGNPDLANDCDPATFNGDHQIVFNFTNVPSGFVYDTWLPKPGDSITFEVQLVSPNNPVDGTWHIDVTPAGGGARAITSNPGEYFNDPDRDTAEDFSFVVDPITKVVTITCNDYAGSITVYAQVQVYEAADSQPLVGNQITFPPDSDGDGLPDAWETQYGDLVANEDDDDDDLTNLEEYWGFKWGPELVEISPVASGGVYQTDAYVPQGDADHFRTHPFRPDLFGKAVGYNFNEGHSDSYNEPLCGAIGCPFALGKAYYNAGIDVHVLSLDNLPQHMDDDIDTGIATNGVASWEKYLDAVDAEHHFIRTVQINNRLDKPMSGTDGHINKKGIRYWSWDTKGWSGIGDEFAYGLGTTTYWISLYNYVYDLPYKDQAPTEDNTLNPIVVCQDENDNGINDQHGKGQDKYWEAGCSGCTLADDVYIPGSYSEYASTFDIDRDFRVELPVKSDPANLNPGSLDIDEYTIPQILKCTITHEWGHAIGSDHDGDPTSIMYHISNNWKRDDKFSQYAMEQQRFINH